VDARGGARGTGTGPGERHRLPRRDRKIAARAGRQRSDVSVKGAAGFLLWSKVHRDHRYGARDGPRALHSPLAPSTSPNLRPHPGAPGRFRAVHSSARRDDLARILTSRELADQAALRTARTRESSWSSARMRSVAGACAPSSTAAVEHRAAGHHVLERSSRRSPSPLRSGQGTSVHLDAGKVSEALAPLWAGDLAR